MIGLAARTTCLRPPMLVTHGPAGGGASARRRTGRLAKDALKILHVVGARPNFMKAAPLLRAMTARDGFVQRLVHTGQHYDESMSRQFFEDLDLREPDVDLGVGSGSHAWQTAQVMLRFEPVLLEFAPDWVVVFGDVNSTAACSLVAVKLGFRLAHVEAGLRSFDQSMPEEVNRVVTDALADLLLTPSADADDNLRREGVAEERIRLVGNLMIDTLVQNLAAARRSKAHARLQVAERGFVYVTLHRPSNVDDRQSLCRIIDGLLEVAAKLPVVFPVHPRTRERLEAFRLWGDLESSPSVRLTGPLGYHDSICLTEQAACVLTDSGGLQEETTYLGVPCLTLRPNTERPITISQGSNRLTRQDRLAADLEEAMKRREAGSSAPRPPLWDGRAAERAVEAFLERPLGVSKR
jgi:UDP-N-acetylglucosamine 2-epimerase (non-hydrolysing)